MIMLWPGILRPCLLDIRKERSGRWRAILEAMDEEPKGIQVERMWTCDFPNFYGDLYILKDRYTVLYL